MLTDEQVRVLRRKLMEGKTQEGAAAAAGMSVRSARHWQSGPYPSKAHRPHNWGTRRDPFVEVFDREIVPLLAVDEQRLSWRTEESRSFRPSRQYFRDSSRAPDVCAGMTNRSAPV
jgi:hypothetical protein